MLKTIMFDLDGTLLPMDQDKFTNAYFVALSKKLAPHGYEPKELSGAIWKGIAAMIGNDGTDANEQAFWREFDGVYGEKGRADRQVFDEFYENDFDGVRDSCGFDARSANTVKALKDMGYELVLATNPVFPMLAQRKRLGWTGCDERDFIHITSYENSGFCKPNPAYYTEILQKIGRTPDECIMAGNDVAEDMAAQKAGIRTFLVTDCLINKNGADISAYPHGNLDDFIDFVKSV